MERHLLVVLAHPDDESMGMGGTIALHSRAGVPVTYVCATRGQMGRHMGRPSFANRETLRALREQELREACRVLGISDLRFLGLWDKTVELEPRQEVADRIRRIIEEVRPSLLLTFHPQHGGHQDHCAVGDAAILAVKQVPANERPVVKSIIHPALVERVGLPVEQVDIRPVAETKLAAVRAHRSQSQGLAGGWAWKENAIDRYLKEFPTEYYTRML